MPQYIEKLEMQLIPVVAIRGIVAFPAIPLSLEISNENDIKAIEKANDEQLNILLVSQKNIAVEEPKEEDLYTVGTVCKIKQFLKLPEGTARLIVDCLNRAQIIKYDKINDIVYAQVMSKTINVNEGTLRSIALMREITNQFEEFIKYMPKLSNELILAVKAIKDPGLFADFVAYNILANHYDKQEILEEYDPIKRLEKLAVLMAKELRIVTTEMSIHKKVRAQIENNQREYYLREQLKVIQNELGDNSADNEIEEYEELILKAQLPKEIENKLFKELHKLSKTPYNSAEAAVLSNYLDICLELPWTKTTKDRIDIALAKKMLDADHYGLTKIKERILEFLAVKQLNQSVNNQIICLVGPPGTGKTSIAESIARSMKRKFVRVCLGGVRDEADIRGHRKTYIGSMPGRIISAIKQAGSRNPLILLDEIDKLTKDAHGDPSSALLEVLDSEQNKKFRDHYIEMPIDLSECVFIATANDLSTVPTPLIDRMEVIELNIYNRFEKLAIAKNHLIKRQIKMHGLSSRMLKITDEALLEIIDEYTSEAGVRNLNREIASICRKTAKIIIETGVKKCTVTKENLHEFLGTKKIKTEKISETDEIGVVNGLAYTSIGGDLLKVEVSVLPGTGKIELTGSLGDVMKESARAAISFIRSKADILNIDNDFYNTKDIHIHVPEGAVPKDGPSAGITIATALISELTKRPVKRDVAMTGEITLRGKILAIGGLREKSMAAYKAGAKTVIIPKDNLEDLEEVNSLVKENINFVPCSVIDEVLAVALVE